MSVKIRAAFQYHIIALLVDYLLQADATVGYYEVGNMSYDATNQRQRLTEHVFGQNVTDVIYDLIQLHKEVTTVYKYTTEPSIQILDKGIEHPSFSFTEHIICHHRNWWEKVLQETGSEHNLFSTWSTRELQVHCHPLCWASVGQWRLPGAHHGELAGYHK